MIIGLLLLLVLGDTSSCQTPPVSMLVDEEAFIRLTKSVWSVDVRLDSKL
ncbi:hypothetical protein KCP69_21685 [Salmonella enterica subsp. enterica]|nr:hypothetical protein KCP69_21685 [Salmonella enterica subsp. enterica]